jgi:hypothetical protein
MKMVKSLLLGSAAGLVAVAGAQAADLPVKAKAVEYVKVCSLYGAGFYYMPGTDICLKIGGFVRAQVYANHSNSGTGNAFTGSSGQNDRFSSPAAAGGGSPTGNQDFQYRSRIVASFDTRQQTEYGTLRTYMNIGWTVDGGALQGTTPAYYANRAFIQLAGFTFGKAQSFFEIMNNPSVTYFGWFGPDTGDGGQLLMAYTAQFGNGFTGTLSVEDARRSQIVNNAFDFAGGALTQYYNAQLNGAQTTITAGGAFTTTAAPNHYANNNVPDIVGNLRVDQAWGSAQVMAALHQVRADYYTTTNIASGHPGDKYGWVVGAGTIINANFITPGDKFQFNVNYTEGAIRYITGVWPGNWTYANGSSAAFGLEADAVYQGSGSATGSGLELTKGFIAQASYDHLWNQRWKTSLYGGYIDIKYGDNANRYLCGTALQAIGCDASWSAWNIGSRTQFNINASTYLGFDVMYAKFNTSTLGNTNVGGVVMWNTPGGGHVGNYSFADQDAVSATFRIHRDFLP